jgi:hypothetical protein
MVTPWPHNLGEMGTGGPAGVCVCDFSEAVDDA